MLGMNEPTSARSSRHGVSIYRLKISPGQYTRTWYYRPQKNGERYFFPLGEFLNDQRIKNRNKDVEIVMGAKKLADQIYTFLRSPGKTMQDAIAFFDPKAEETGDQASEFPTLEQVLSIYRKVGQRLGVNPVTQGKNVDMLCTILRRAEAEANKQPYKATPGKRPDNNIWFDQPIDQILTRKTVIAFQDSMLADGDEEDVDYQKRRIRSANSMLTQARSIFGRDYLDEYRAAGLKFPEPWGWLEARKIKGGNLYFQLPPYSVIQNILEASAKLKQNDPNAYRAFVLAIHCSCRRSEAANTKWAWFDAVGDSCRLRITSDGKFDPKHGHGREVVIAKHVYEELRSMATETDSYLIEGGEMERAGSEDKGGEVFTRLNSWLREMGLKEMKPYHGLRKLWFSSKGQTGRPARSAAAGRA